MVISDCENRFTTLQFNMLYMFQNVKNTRWFFCEKNACLPHITGKGRGNVGEKYDRNDSFQASNITQ